MSRNPLPLDEAKRYTGYRTIEQVELAFWAKVDRRGPDDCWLWTRGVNGRGYGQFSTKLFPIARTAHRWAYYFAHGELPSEPELRHTCHRPGCCNPNHLIPGTRLQNEQDKDAAGRRPRGIKNLPCPHCGGPQEGRSKRRDSGREFAFCIPCRRTYMAEYHQRRKVAQAEE